VSRHPLVVLDGIPRPAFVGGPTGIEGFAAGWEALGGHVHRVTSDAGVPGAVAAAAAGRGPVLVAPGVPGGVSADLRWPECGVDGAASAGVGVVRAVAAVAATNSIVIDSRNGRSPSLLPVVAVFVIDAATVVDTPSDVLRQRQRWWPDGVPSQVVLVSGPSRSADIEMTLTVGVHGPGEVHAVFVG
jgi:hypothetical protein